VEVGHLFQIPVEFKNSIARTGVARRCRHDLAGPQRARCRSARRRAQPVADLAHRPARGSRHPGDLPHTPTGTQSSFDLLIPTNP